MSKKTFYQLLVDPSSRFYHNPKQLKQFAIYPEDAIFIYNDGRVNEPISEVASSHKSDWLKLEIDVDSLAPNFDEAKYVEYIGAPWPNSNQNIFKVVSVGEKKINILDEEGQHGEFLKRNCRPATEEQFLNQFKSK